MTECNSVKKTYNQRKTDVAPNRAKDKYENNNKKRFKEQARDKNRNLSEKGKNKKREYGKNRYHNIHEEKKQKLKESEKNYLETKKLK